MRRCILLTGAKYAVAGAIAAGAFVASTEIVRADGRAAPRGAPVVQQAPTSWSGFYFGAHSGWQWSQLDASVAGTSVFNVEHDSPVVGGQIGIQHQFGLFVVGIEGTLTVAYQDDHASTQCPNPLFTCAARFDDVITIGPRLGWAMGKWMPYLTGGYASAAFDQKISLNTASSNPFGDVSATAAGTSAAASTWRWRRAGRSVSNTGTTSSTTRPTTSPGPWLRPGCWTSRSRQTGPTPPPTSSRCAQAGSWAVRHRRPHR